MPINSSQKGFTLIELLLSVVIIGILSGIVLTVINPQRQQARARDGVRAGNIAKLGQSLEAYNAGEGSYPSGPSGEATLRASGYVQSWPTENGVTYRYLEVCEAGFCIGCLDVPMATDTTRFFKYVTGWDVSLMGSLTVNGNRGPGRVLYNCSTTQSCSSNDSGTCIQI